MKNLTVRLLTAAVAIPVILGLLYKLPWWGFGALAGAAMCVGTLELLGMTHPGDRASQVFGLGMSAGLWALFVSTNFGSTQAVAVLAAVMCVAPAALVWTLFRPREQHTAMMRMAALGLAPLYVGGGLAAIACVRMLFPPGREYVGAGLVVLSLTTAWFGDTGGYFAGRGFGGPKLYPSVSPNKTWAGAVGGLAGSAVAAVAAHFIYLREMPLPNGIAVCVMAGALGQVGDLAESLMKRSTGVKDSGGILPGHGGILDRVDALLFVAPVIYAAARSGWLWR